MFRKLAIWQHPIDLVHKMPLPFIYVEFFFRDLGTCAMWDLSFLKSNVEKGKVPIGFFFFFPPQYYLTGFKFF